MQSSLDATDSDQHGRSRRVPAVLVIACVLMSAYWIAVTGVYAFKSLNPQGRETAVHYLATGRQGSNATWRDPVFHVLPIELRRDIIYAIDAEFTRLSRADQYLVLTELARENGPRPEVASALTSAISSANWTNLPVEPIDRIDYAVAHSIPYGVALTALVILFAVVSWLFSTMPLSVARPTVVAAGLVLVLGMTLYPPWALQIKSEAGHVLSTTYKYGWLFTPPTPDGDTSTIATVDWSRLLLAWFVVGIAVTGAAYLLPNRPQSSCAAVEPTHQSADSPS